MFDPKALHHVVVKDQEVYEEAVFAMVYVAHIFSATPSLSTDVEQNPQAILWPRTTLHSRYAHLPPKMISLCDARN